MKLRIEINMDGAAFEDGNGAEVARILAGLAAMVDGYDLLPGEPADVLRDLNGNACGTVEVAP